MTMEVQGDDAAPSTPQSGDAELEASLRALPPRYEPNALLRWLYRRFFDRIEVDPAWTESVREAAALGTVVYALRNLSLLDFLALDHLTKRYGLPQVRFANNLGLWLLEPFGKGVQHALSPRTRDDDVEDLRAAVTRGESAAVFLKRPPTVLAGSSTGRGLLEGDDFLRELVELQRRRIAAGDVRPIVVVPQLFLWTKRPDTRQRSILDAVIGTREWPGAVRTAGQFLFNYRDVTVRAGEPLDLRQFLDHDDAETEGGRAPTDVVVRRVVYLLLKRLERERRVIVGPVVKASDRIVEEIVRTPRVRKVIDELAGEGERERFIVEARARAMLREMAAAMEPDVIKAFGSVMEAIFHRIYDGVEIDMPGIERVREAARKGTVILLPSHKSHVDYLLVSYVLWRNSITPPLIAAGDNLTFFPMGPIFRRAGAFFIRRAIGNDRLYSAVLDAYVHKIVREGYSIEFFLEGGRSRTGKLLAPKLGLLGMVVDAAYELPSRTIYFVPISIGYERVVEAKSYVRELSGGEKEGESVTGLVRAARVLAERYGRLNLQFGEILTLDRIRRDVEASATRSGGSSFVPKRAIVARLGHQITYEINRATAVTGGSLVALALLTHPGRGVPHSALERTCGRLLSTLDHLGARIQPSLRGEGGGPSLRAIADALALFVSAGWVEEHDEEGAIEESSPIFRRGRRSRVPVIETDDAPEPVYVVPDEKRLSVDLSKNVIIHFFVPYALICTALSVAGPRAKRSLLRERVQRLSRLFKFEFMFRADATFAEIFDETLADLASQGVLSFEPGEEALVEVAEGDEARARVALYAATIASFLEGYRVVARALAMLLKQPKGVAQKELVKRAISVGKRMALSGEVSRREGICRPVLENAVAAFLDQGYLAKSEGKLVLAASFATLSAVQAIEARVASFLVTGAPSSSTPLGEAE